MRGLLPAAGCSAKVENPAAPERQDAAATSTGEALHPGCIHHVGII